MDDRAARNYQVEIAKKAIKQNSIVCLGTGTGKTFISGIVVKELQGGINGSITSDSNKKEDGGKRTFFIVSTVPLVKQQAKELRLVTCLKIGEFTGDMGVDFWSKEDWVAQFNQNDVLVMTAQILVNILTCHFIGLHNINLIVFDECHNASKNHPYVNILEFHENCAREKYPHILGLTASIINKKCKKKSQKEIHDFIDFEIKCMEARMRSVCVTCSNPLATAIYATRPRETVLSYVNHFVQNPVYSGLEGIDDLMKEFQVIEAELADLKKKYKPHYNAIEINSPKKADFTSLVSNWKSDRKEADIDSIAHTAANYCLQVLADLGYMSVYDLAKICLQSIGAIHINDAYQRTVIDEIESVLQNIVITYERCIAKSPFKTEDRVVPMEPFITNKALTLLSDVLHEEQKRFRKDFDTDMCAIVFVEKRCTAIVLTKLINYCSQTHDKMFGDLKSKFVLGHQAFTSFSLPGEEMCSNAQNNVLDEFKANEFNILVSTSIVEEGLDVQKCNLVVRFDSIGNFRQYAQSKGRARRQNSKFIIMSPDKDTMLMELKVMQELEQYVLSKCRLKDPKPLTEKERQKILYDEKKGYIPTYYIDTPYSASITRNSCVPLLGRFCQKLPSDEYCRSNPVYTYEERFDKITKMNVVRVTALLPAAFPLEEKVYTGDWMPFDKDRKPVGKKSKLEAKGHLGRKSVAMYVCILLHKKGFLDYNLLVNLNGDDDDDDDDDNDDDDDKMEVDPSEDQKVSLGFDDLYVRKVPDQLMTRGTLWYLYEISMRLTEATDLGLEGLWNNKTKGLGVLMPCDVHFANSPFIKLYSKAGCVTVQLNFIQALDFIDDSFIKFHQSIFNYCSKKYVYGNIKHLHDDNTTSKALLVPLKFNSDAAGCEFDCDTLIRCCRDEKRAIQTGSVISKTYIQHDRTYYVTEVLNKKAGDVMDKNSTYVDHYKKKYNLHVNPSSPLLRVLPISKKVSYTPNSEEEQKADKNLTRVENLVPDICTVTFNGEASIHQQVSLLPHIFYALESLMNADELRKRIASKLGCIGEYSNTTTTFCGNNENEGSFKKSLKSAISQTVSVSATTGLPSVYDILRSITTKQSSYPFDLERHEMLGDSFLKIAVTVHMFFKYPSEYEGTLNDKRKSVISNEYLFGVAKKMGLQQILCHSQFGTNTPDKRNANTVWLPPGYLRELDALNTDGMKSSYQMVKLKSLADSVEALIGVHLCSGGMNLALKFIQSFLKINVMFDTLPAKSKDVVKSLTVPSQYADYPVANTAVLSCVDDEDVERVVMKVYRESKLNRLEEKIGYTFRDKSYLLQAVKHLSHDVHRVTDCYQRLEFLGDSVLDFLVTQYVFLNIKDISPGDLTLIRSALVNNNVLALLVVKYGFDTHVMNLSSALTNDMKQFKKDVGFDGIEFEKDVFESFFENPFVIIPKNSNEGVLAPKILGDIFESIVGAVFLDCHMDLIKVWDVLLPLMRDIIGRYMRNIPRNPISEFTERYADDFEFSFSEDGVCTLTFDKGRRSATGSGKNKKMAKITATWKALNQTP